MNHPAELKWSNFLIIFFKKIIKEIYVLFSRKGICVVLHYSVLWLKPQTTANLFIELAPDNAGNGPLSQLSGALAAMLLN